jgi:transposase
VQKPQRRAKERNEEAILRWQSEEFPRIARAAEARAAHLVFLDESGFFLTPTVRRTWGPRGQTPILDAWDRRDRISAISSISVSPKNRRLNLHFDLLEDNTNVQAEDIVTYLQYLKEHVGSRLTILWDGSRIHDRSALVRAFLAEHPEIVTERLPAYAPELNPDELVWAWTKYGRLGNLAAQHADWLRDYLISEFTYVRTHPDLLTSFIEKTSLPLRL